MRTERLEEFAAYAKDFAHSLVPRDRATVIALSGELGAGKTTFTQVLARTLGVEEAVQSPTFVIEKIYPLQNQAFARLIHIDAYRLKSEQELDVLHWGELLQDASNLMVLEWPEMVPRRVPPDAIRIRFDIEGDARIITTNGGEKSSS